MKTLGFALSLSFVMAFAGLSHAQNAKGAKGAKGQKRAGSMGKVASIDTAKKTLTLTGRKNETITVSFTDQTKVTKAEAGKMDGLKSGDAVMVNGAVSGTTVEARTIALLPSTIKLPKKAPKKAPTNAIRGSISSTSPLKVRMADTEYEVKITEATKVITSSDGTISDVKVGDTVRVQGQPGSDGVVQAQRIDIVPAGVAAKGKKASKNAAKVKKANKNGA
jgi:hypothetical protein